MRVEGEEINKLAFKMIQMSSVSVAFCLPEKITVTRTSLIS